MGVPLVPTTADHGDSGGAVAVDMQCLAVREALRTAKEAFKLQEDAQYGKAMLRSSDGLVRISSCRTQIEDMLPSCERAPTGLAESVWWEVGCLAGRLSNRAASAD